MVARAGILSLLVMTSCFNPGLPALECAESNFCPVGLVCRLPEHICVEPGAGADAAADGNNTVDSGVDGPPLQAMVDRGLLARYFIDEAASGTAPTDLIDSAASPLPLPIAYGATNNLAFVEVGGHRGLQWAVAGGDGAASTAVTGTKIADLDGLEEATYEVVVDLTALSPMPFSRILHIGVSGSLGNGSLLTDSANALSLAYDGGAERTTWAVDLFGGRQVIHAVFDANQGSGGDRLRLYVDGVLVANPTGSVPAAGGSISLDAADEFLIGNNPLVRRAFQGVIHYAAIYTVALDAGEVANNAARLTASDDR